MSVDSRTVKSVIEYKLNQNCMSVDGEFEDLDNYMLDETVKRINDACTVLKCLVMTRTKALLIYHYFRRCVAETRYDPYMVAAACISLSIKYNEEPVEFDAIILIFFRILDQRSHRSTQSREFKEIRKSVTMMECLILRMMEFSLNHVVAHEYLTYFMNDICEELSTHNMWDVFSEICTRLASDFYLSNKCLNYKAEEIAVTVVQVSFYLLGVDVNAKGSSHLKMRLKRLTDCPESKTCSIIEDIFRICVLGSSAESRRREN